MATAYFWSKYNNFAPIVTKNGQRILKEYLNQYLKEKNYSLTYTKCEGPLCPILSDFEKSILPSLMKTVQFGK